VLRSSPEPAGPDWIRHAVARTDAPPAVWPATPESIAVARNEIARRAGEAGASDELLADIRLAVSEACTNAIQHSYVSGEARSQTFSVSTAARSGVFSVWVADEGRGVPASRPSPGMGIGLKIMSELAHDFRIGVLPDGATQVELHFDLHAERAPAEALL
jgi:serine/threonine-protein kinase RsbW